MGPRSSQTTLSLLVVLMAQFILLFKTYSLEMPMNLADNTRTPIVTSHVSLPKVIKALWAKLSNGQLELRGIINALWMMTWRISVCSLSLDLIPVFKSLMLSQLILKKSCSETKLYSHSKKIWIWQYLLGIVLERFQISILI